MQIATQEQSIIEITRAEIRKNGLIIEEGLDRSEWVEGVVKPLKYLINTMQGSALWWWGDALAYGEKNYGETYTKAIEQSGYTYQSLANAKAVSERIEFSSRLENLSWSHHAEIAMAVDDKAKRIAWLKRAEAEQLSKSELRKAIRMSKAVYRDPINEDAGQFEAISAAKELRAFFEKQDVTKWSEDRCRLWMPDLAPLAKAHTLMTQRYPAQ